MPYLGIMGYHGTCTVLEHSLLGWNNWECFGVSVTEDEDKANGTGPYRLTLEV